MKLLLLVLIASLLLLSCQKKVSEPQSINGVVIATDALTPLPCHTTNFVTDYPTKPGEVPPFRFSKTLYSDTRVKTINVLSRAYPIHWAFKKQAFEIIGTFTYSTNKATLTGTKQLWEYYKTPAGAAAKRSISKANVKLDYLLDPNTGYCHTVNDLQMPSGDNMILRISYGDPKYGGNANALEIIEVSGSATMSPADGDILYYPSNDKYGNTTMFHLLYNPYSSYPSYVYDYTIPRSSKKYSFIPSQNLISQEYSLCEIMQWTPQPTHQGKSVSGTFFYGNSHTKVTQSQVYKNYKFDAKGNETSVTYADNILQKTSWFCK